jgi:hypothetical protein
LGRQASTRRSCASLARLCQGRRCGDRSALRRPPPHRGGPNSTFSRSPVSRNSSLMILLPRVQATLTARLDLIDSRIKDSTLELQNRLLEDCEELREQIEKQVDRLRELKDKQEQNPCASNREVLIVACFSRLSVSTCRAQTSTSASTTRLLRSRMSRSRLMACPTPARPLRATRSTRLRSQAVPESHRELQKPFCSLRPCC